jgi:hypothetical protein
VVAYTLVDDQDYELAVEAGPWYRKTSGYAAHSGPHGKQVFLHRLLLGLAADDKRHTDHLDRNRLNNQRANIRAVTRAQNRQNLPSFRGSSSRFRGVGWYTPRQKWRAYAKVGGKIRYLGLFSSEEEAGKVAAAFRKLHMPFSSDAAG